MNDTYYAKDNSVYVRQLDGGDELFLTVHETQATMTPEQQAVVLVGMLNDL